MCPNTTSSKKSDTSCNRTSMSVENDNEVASPGNAGEQCSADDATNTNGPTVREEEDLAEYGADDAAAHSAKYANWPLKNVKEPSPNDVLYGRGGGTNHHPGNKRYRRWVEERKVEYVNSKRLDKPIVALDIVKRWRGQSPPGRFLKLDEKTGTWNDVGDKKAREKTSQALREKAPEIRKELEKEAHGGGGEVSLLKLVSFDYYLKVFLIRGSSRVRGVVCDACQLAVAEESSRHILCISGKLRERVGGSRSRVIHRMMSSFSMHFVFTHYMQSLVNSSTHKGWR